MKLRNLNIIIAREYLTRVKKRSFLLITFLGPLFFAGVAVLPSLIMMMSADDSQKIAMVDQSGIVAQRMLQENTISFTDLSTENPDPLLFPPGNFLLVASAGQSLPHNPFRRPHRYRWMPPSP